MGDDRRNPASPRGEAERAAGGLGIALWRATSTARSTSSSSSARLRRGDAQTGLPNGWGTILPGQEITLEDVYAHTAVTYPTAGAGDDRGRDSSDHGRRRRQSVPRRSLLSPGGDMVRLGGLTYAIDPSRRVGSESSTSGLPGAPRPGPSLQGNRLGEPRRGPGPPAWDVGRLPEERPAAKLQPPCASGWYDALRGDAVGSVSAAWRSSSWRPASCFRLLPARMTRSTSCSPTCRSAPVANQTPLPFTLESVGGKQVSLAGLRGRAALLYFWEAG